jgi:hypothetical protein
MRWPRRDRGGHRYGGGMILGGRAKGTHQGWALHDGAHGRRGHAGEGL